MPAAPYQLASVIANILRCVFQVLHDSHAQILTRPCTIDVKPSEMTRWRQRHVWHA